MVETQIPDQIFQQAQQLKDNGQSQQAIDAFQKSHQLYQQANDLNGLANCQQMIGVCYAIEQNYLSALDNLHQSAALYQNLNHQRAIGNVYRDIGLVYFQQQQYPPALEWLNKSSHLLSQTDDKVSLGITLGKSALVFMATNQIDKAKLLFKQSLTLIREQGSWFMEMTALLDWAKLNYLQQDFHQMITKLWACFGIISEHRVGDSQYRRLAQIYGLLAQGHLHLQNISAAVTFFLKSYQFLKTMPDNVRQPVIQDMQMVDFLHTLKQNHYQQYTTLINQIDLKILNINYEARQQ